MPGMFDTRRHSHRSRVRTTFSHDHPRLIVAAALALSIVAIYAVLAVIIGVISGHNHAWIFWPTIALFLLFAVWVARRAQHLWRIAGSSKKQSEHRTK